MAWYARYGMICDLSSVPALERRGLIVSHRRLLHSSHGPWLPLLLAFAVVVPLLQLHLQPNPVHEEDELLLSADWVGGHGLRAGDVRHHGGPPGLRAAALFRGNALLYRCVIYCRFQTPASIHHVNALFC